jgi:hypothetical protein
MIPLEANIQHMQGDLWEVAFKVAADLTGHNCRFVLMSGATAVMTCLTSDGTMTASYDPAETLTVNGVTETGVTTLTPVLTLADSAKQTPGVYDYECEDLAGETLFRGKCSILAEVSK